MISELKLNIANKISQLVREEYRIEVKDLALSYPPDLLMGDFAVECFGLARDLKKSPAEIAASIAGRFMADELIENISAAGPYINIKVRSKELFSRILKDVGNSGPDFGNTSINEKETIIVEYLQPNTNKPLHLGHVRNGALGMAIANILTASGAEVVRANLINDRGIHICKSMLAWMKWGQGSTPESMKMKGDHFVGYWYVRFSKEAAENPALEEEARELLRKWEAGDPEIISVWEKMNGWVYEGFEKSFETFNFMFDKVFYESNTYILGKEIVEEGVEKGIFKREENGAVTAILPKEEFGTEKDGTQKKVTLIRPDGTSVYLTQDLGTAKLKAEELKLTQSIYVVGSEQDYHFQVLFKLLSMLGFPWARKCYHLSYGMVYLPEGKMKSREGIIVDADDLAAEMKKMALEEIEGRDKDGTLSQEELENRSAAVADAAIKYYLLQFSPQQDIHFDPKVSLSFEGNTGPYCQYSYARAKSILAKSGKDIDRNNIDYSALIELEERMVANRLIDFSVQIQKAALELNPSRVSSATYELAKAFNQFYHKHQVLNLEDDNLRAVRLLLVKSVAIAIKKGLSLLNIKVLEQM